MYGSWWHCTPDYFRRDNLWIRDCGLRVTGDIVPAVVAIRNTDADLHWSDDTGTSVATMRVLWLVALLWWYCGWCGGWKRTLLLPALFWQHWYCCGSKQGYCGWLQWSGDTATGVASNRTYCSWLCLSGYTVTGVMWSGILGLAYTDLVTLGLVGLD